MPIESVMKPPGQLKVASFGWVEAWCWTLTKPFGPSGKGGGHPSCSISAPAQDASLNNYKEFTDLYRDGRAAAVDRATADQGLASRAFSGPPSPLIPSFWSRQLKILTKNMMGRRLHYLYCNCPQSTFLESNYRAFYPTVKSCEWSFLSKNKRDFMKDVSKPTELCFWVPCLRWRDQGNESHRALLINALHEKGPGVTLYRDCPGKPGLHWRLSEWLTSLFMWMGFLVVLVTANRNSFHHHDIHIHQWWHQLWPLYVWKEVLMPHFGGPMGALWSPRLPWAFIQSLNS